MCLDQKYTYNATSESVIKPVKIIKNHGNGQFGGWFGHCVGCAGAVPEVGLRAFSEKKGFSDLA